MLTVLACPCTGLLAGRKEFEAGSLQEEGLQDSCLCVAFVHSQDVQRLALPWQLQWKPIASTGFTDVSFIAASPGNSLGFGQNWHQAPSLGHRASVGREMGMFAPSSGLAFLSPVTESSQRRWGQAVEWREDGAGGFS